MLKNEHLLAIEIARIDPDIHRIQKLLETNVDYEMFFDLLDKHKLKSLFISNIVGKIKNAEIEKYIEKYKHNLERQIDLYVDETTRISKLFCQSGIKNIVFKGVAFIHNVYKRKYARSFGDADYLISTEDIIRSHYLLLNLGYEILPLGIGYEVVDYNRKMTEEYLLELAAKREKLYNYRNIKNNFRLELHHIHNEWAYEQIYNKRYIKLNDMYLPDEIGQYMVACLGVWQHANHLNFAVQYLRLWPHQLRRLTDVYESYRVVLRNNKIQLVLSMENKSFLNKICYVMHIVKMFYPDVDLDGFSFVESNDLYGKDHFLWTGKNYKSDIKDRFFTPKDEFNKIYDGYKKYLEGMPKTKMPCSFQKGETISFHANDCESDLYWDSRVFSTCFPAKNRVKVSFSIFWDNDSFYFKAAISCTTVKFDCCDRQKNEGSSKDNFIWLGFGKERNEKPIGFSFLLCDEEKSIAYKCSSPEGNLYKNIVRASKFTTEMIDDGYCICIGITWQTIGFDPTQQKAFLFDFCVSYSSEMEVEFFYWNGGRGGLMDFTCLTFRDVELL